MNKKGFTLVELLAVLIILAILATITTTAIINQINESKKTLTDAQISIVKQASIEYAEKKGLFKIENKTYNICIDSLKSEGLLDDTIINSLDKNYYIKLNVECDNICTFKASNLNEYDKNIECN